MLRQLNGLNMEVEKTFLEVQKLTHCSTGCGKCHDKILDAISELMSGR